MYVCYEQVCKLSKPITPVFFKFIINRNDLVWPLDPWVNEYSEYLKQWKFYICSKLQYFSLNNISMMFKSLGFDLDIVGVTSA